uniref:Sfi1 spindle body domain-containing protein n=1 Tax=Phaeomonas parva TaxID=124430 RepID=A0A7S1UF93_9STRA|mmetsp:Transcript_45465/g.142436  ORF Transcript_45465/g.142436 Transcript_45465/m.142436 type:complete len:524 (+) Transcript_45465:215-1786(+)
MLEDEGDGWGQGGRPAVRRPLRLLRRTAPVCGGHPVSRELHARPVRLLDVADKDPVQHPEFEDHYLLLTPPETKRRYTHAQLQVPAYLRSRPGALTNRPPRRYKPCSLRPQQDVLPDWVRHGRFVLARRYGAAKARDRGRHIMALAFFTRLVLKHWSKYVRIQRRLRPKLLRILRRAEMRGAWVKWVRQVAAGRIAQIRRRQFLRRGVDQWRLAVGMLRQRELALRDAHDAVHDRYRRRMRQQYWETWRERLRLEGARYTAKMALLKLLRHGSGRKMRDGFERWVAYCRMLADMERQRRLAKKAGREAADRARMKRFARMLFSRIYLGVLRDAWRRLNRRRSAPVPLKRSTFCNCVAEVLKFGRCSCSPAAHLLKRLEGLHQLVEHVDAEHAFAVHKRLPILTEGRSVAWENKTLTGGLPEWDPSRSYVHEYVKRRPFERGLDSVLRASGELPQPFEDDEFCPEVGADDVYEDTVLRQAAEIEARRAVGSGRVVRMRQDRNLLATHARQRGQMSKWEYVAGVP